MTECYCNVFIAVRHNANYPLHLPPLSRDRYEPCEMLLDVYETVYKIRSTLLAHKNSLRTSQVQAAAKQVPLLKFLHLISQ